jgi:hypothetical protein
MGRMYPSSSMRQNHPSRKKLPREEILQPDWSFRTAPARAAESHKPAPECTKSGHWHFAATCGSRSDSKALHSSCNFSVRNNLVSSAYRTQNCLACLRGSAGQQPSTVGRRYVTGAEPKAPECVTSVSRFNGSLTRILAFAVTPPLHFRAGDSQ